MYIDYYNAIETLIKQGLTDIKTVDWYNRQYERYEDLKAVGFPAVYIEFDNPLIWNTEGNGVQSANTEIKLHLVVKDLADSPTSTLELAKELHKLMHLKALMNGTDQLSTKLMRTSSELINDYDQLKVITLTYATNLIDCSAGVTGTSVSVALNLQQQ